ncbi:MAG: type VI secretion system tip protein VgrG [Mediterranea sp.]|jgi:Rhs element Vgr protein|nr:type VI secretion system tip protein VgrG [Mediterranea sp.]
MSNQELAYTIYCNGKKLDDSFELVSASVRSGLNRIGKATLIFNAGNMDKQTFDESDSDAFIPGNSLRLDAGNINKQTTLFDGVIISVGICAGRDTRSQMIVECGDAFYPATLSKKCCIFKDQTDSDMIKKVLSPYGNVTVETTSYQHPQFMQYNVSDWAFARRCATACGMCTRIEGKNIEIVPPKVSGTPAITIIMGSNLIAFDVKLTGRNLASENEAVSWDYTDQSVAMASASLPTLNEQGDLEPSKIAAIDTRLWQTDATIDTTALELWTNGQALFTGLSRYEGTLEFEGCTEVKPGCLIELKSFGKRFDGLAFVGTVTQLLQDNLLTTKVSLGIPNEDDDDEYTAKSYNAPRFVSPIHGPHIGIVKQLQGDPANQYRILVEFPWMQESENKELWARHASPYATKDAGVVLLPEIGDEVVVVFGDNNPANVIIIGSLYSSQLPPPITNDDKNIHKMLKTMSGLTIECNEEKKIISIATPAGNKWEINDSDKCICSTDQHGNIISMNSNGITLKSAKDIQLKTQGQFTADATGDAKLTTKANMTLEGITIKGNAKTQLELKAAVKAELSANTQTIIKGGMVMIN